MSGWWRSVRADELADFELELVTEAIRRRRGPDFSGYSRESLKRRLALAAQGAGETHLSGLLDLILYDDARYSQLLSTLYVSVTAFFRDAGFFRALRDLVIPYLETFPRLHIWHAGCATGEEVYSLAILLSESGLLQRSRIYATDANVEAIRCGQAGVYPLEALRAASTAYAEAGGVGALGQYFAAMPSPSHPDGTPSGVMAEDLRTRISWSRHDIASEPVFSGVHLILCRNTLIYFRRPMQDAAIGVMAQSLRHNGVLCLGDKEVLDFSVHCDLFDTVAGEHRIYSRAALSRRAGSTGPTTGRMMGEGS